MQEEPAGKVLTDDELKSLDCDFPGQMYGELIYLVDAGTIICPSFMGESHIAGMHGYHPHDKDSIAMLASSVEPEPKPKRLDNMYELMLNEATRL